MVKKKASLAGRGAEILFGTKGPPPTPEPLTNDAQTNETLESDQKDDDNTGDRTSSTPAPANMQPRPLTNTAAPLEVGPDRPAPVRNVLPPGTVVNVNPSATPTVAPTRTYDIPPPSDFESDPAGGASISGAPTATVPPSRANNMTVGTTPVATPTSQPATTPGGNVSNPSSTPPSRGTSVVSPTTTGPQTSTPAGRTAGASNPASSPIPTPTMSSPGPSPAVSTPAPSGTGTSSGTASTTATAQPSGGNGKPMSTTAGGFVPTAPTSIPVPPPISTGGIGAQPSQGQTTPISELLRVAAQAQADRQAALDAAKKAQEQTKVDPDTLKGFRERMFKEILELYETVSTSKELMDSPWIVNYCLQKLERARLLILSNDTAGGLSEAEYLVELVHSKVGHKDEVIPASQDKNVAGILTWQVVVGIFSLFLAVLPWTFPNGLSIGPLQLGVPAAVPTGAPATDVAAAITNAKVFLALLASIGWGGTGAVVATLYNLPWFVQKREYDPAYNLSYIAGPVKGLVVGATMFLIISSGIITNNTTGSVEKFLFVFVVAFLAGFKQEYVFQLFDDLLKVIFRPPQDTKSGTTTPPAKPAS